MCKIIALTNLSKVKSIKKLTETACSLVGETERDGFGYAIQGAKGVFGERTLRPSAFSPSFARPLLTVPFAEPGYNRFGSKSKPAGAGLFHGRTSTNNVSIVNTHPIVKNRWTLIHNGVVTNHGPKYTMETTNDTEHLVHYLSTTGIKGIEEHLTGYYAFGAIAPDGRLHVAKDSTAQLYVAEIPAIDSMVFATRESHITELCEAMNWTHSVTGKVDDDTYLVFEPDGTLITHESIKPRGRTATEDAFSSRSLGYKLDAERPDFDTYAKYSNLYGEPYQATTSPQYSNDELQFLKELEEHGDSSYLIKAYNGRTITIEEFRAMEDDDKLCCTVIRPDGTVVDQVNYMNERLYEGA